MRNPDIHRGSSFARPNFARPTSGNVIPTFSLSLSLSSSRARFIIKFMASSGNRTLYVPDRQRGSEHVSCSRTRRLQEKSCPLPSYGSHSRTPDRSCREPGNSLFRSRGDFARARYKRIFYDSCSCRQYRRGFAVCLYNTAKRFYPREETAPKELDGIFSPRYISRFIKRYKINAVNS